MNLHFTPRSSDVRAGHGPGKYDWTRWDYCRDRKSVRYAQVAACLERKLNDDVLTPFCPGCGLRLESVARRMLESQ